MTSRIRSRRGVTLIELAVALVIIGIMLTVVSLQWSDPGSVRVEEPGTVAAWVAEARGRAIATGSPQTLRLRVSDDGDRAVLEERPGLGAVRRLTAYPDGSVVADSGLPVDRLTGTVHRQRGER